MAANLVTLALAAPLTDLNRPTNDLYEQLPRNDLYELDSHWSPQLPPGAHTFSAVGISYPLVFITQRGNASLPPVLVINASTGALVGAFDQHAMELFTGLNRQDTDFGNALVHSPGGPLKQSFELAEERVRVSVRGRAEGGEPRRVDFALIEAFAELHRRVEERAHRQVEEDLATNGFRGQAVAPEERMAPLLQTKERGSRIVSDDAREGLESEPPFAFEDLREIR